MSRLVIIPARGGSKRIPKENIKMFNGKPIISYVIDTVKKSSLFDEVMVSTDNIEIAEVAKKHGALVPFLRSSKNANDHSTLTDAILEVIESYMDQGRNFDQICCILPTAVLITLDKIEETYQKLINNNYSTVVPVIKYAYPIQRSLKVIDGLLKLREEKYINTRSQDLENHFHDSGQFYWLNTESFLREKKVFNGNTGYVELKEYEAQDVDTMNDWTMLQLKYNFKK